MEQFELQLALLAYGIVSTVDKDGDVHLAECSESIRTNGDTVPFLTELLANVKIADAKLKEAK